MTIIENRPEQASGRFCLCLRAAEGRLHTLHEQLRGGGEDLVALPCQVQPHLLTGCQRAEGEAGVLCGVRQVVEAQRAAHALLHHHGGVEQQVVGAYYVEPGLDQRALSGTVRDDAELSRRQESLLRVYHRELLDGIHEQQHRLDCLDYLLYRLREDIEGKARGGMP